MYSKVILTCSLNSVISSEIHRIMQSTLLKTNTAISDLIQMHVMPVICCHMSWHTVSRRSQCLFPWRIRYAAFKTFQDKKQTNLKICSQYVMHNV